MYNIAHPDVPMQIVGAGPTGLTLGCDQARSGVEFRINEKAASYFGMPEWQVTALLDLQAYYTGGQGGEVDGTLAALLGRPT